MNTTLRIRRRAALLAAGALAATLGGGAAAAPARSEPTHAVVTATASAGFTAETAVTSHPSGPVRSIVTLTDRERATRGMRPYRYDVRLSAVALRWARTMRARQDLQHNPHLSSQVAGWRWLGENVGYGPSVAAVHRAFMASPHHRDNILDRDYTQLGMSVVKDGHGRYWVVEVFRQPG